jgi:hypothetical protein
LGRTGLDRSALRIGGGRPDFTTEGTAGSTEFTTEGTAGSADFTTVDTSDLTMVGTAAAVPAGNGAAEGRPPVVTAVPRAEVATPTALPADATTGATTGAVVGLLTRGLAACTAEAIGSLSDLAGDVGAAAVGDVGAAVAVEAGAGVWATPVPPLGVGANELATD